MKHYKSSLKIAARELRKNMTPTEEMIWFAIRRKKLLDIQFYRQKAIGPYIVDFYAPAVNLVIEIDGAHHLTADNIGQDKFRDASLNELGLRVLRFSNAQVRSTFSKVIAGIITAIRVAKDLPPLKKGVATSEQNNTCKIN